jgi:hypothetical protein
MQGRKRSMACRIVQSSSCIHAPRLQPLNGLNGLNDSSDSCYCLVPNAYLFKRLEQSAAVERLERFERAPLSYSG